MTLVVTVFRRRVLDYLRYPFEAVASIGAYYALFLVLFFGAKAFGGARVSSSDSLSAIAVGYVVFLLTQQAYQSIQGQIQQESMAGTLEQIAMSRYGLTKVLLTDSLALAAVTVVMLSLVIVPIMATTGRWLHFDVPSVAILLALLMTGVSGLGLLMGGLAMVFKRVQGVAGLLQMTFLALVAAPVDRFPVLKLLPVAHGNFLLRRTLVQGRSAFATPAELGILVVVSLAYIALGVTVFKRMDGIARDRALLGQY
jgi:ABC-2 type transport system permease protein